MRAGFSLLSCLLVAACTNLAPPASSQDAAATSAPSPSLAELRCSKVRAEGCDVSLVELLARPEVFHGRKVRVIGFVHFGFESNGIYLHREDFEHSLLLNRIWLNGGSTMNPAVNDGYVLVEGSFDATAGGHPGTWSGAITVDRIQPWSGHGGPVRVMPGPPHQIEKKS